MKIGDYIFLKKNIFTQEVGGDCFKVTPKNSRKFLKFFKVYIQYSPEFSLFPPSICQVFKIAFKNKIDLSCSIINYGVSYQVIF